MRRELERHLLKEEQILFPYVRQLAGLAGQVRPDWASPFGTVANPIAMMEREPTSGVTSIWPAMRTLTCERRRSMLWVVTRLLRRLSALVLTASLAAGHVAVCAGLMGSLESGIADGSAVGCPMHESDSQQTDPHKSAGDTANGNCCAVSKTRGSTPPAATLVSATALALTPSPAPLHAQADISQRDEWRIFAPIRPSSVATHVLLSVFLI
jgi:hypothetical protein